MNKIIAIVGMCGSGKSIASEYYESIGFKKVYFGGVTMDKIKEEGLEITPINEKYMREKLRKQYGMAAYAIILLPKIEEYVKTSNVILDGLYSWDELKILKEKFNDDLVVLAIIVNKQYRYERIGERNIRSYTKEEAINRDVSEIENLAKGGPIAYADYFILNNGSKEEYINDLNKITEEMLNNANNS